MKLMLAAIRKGPVQDVAETEAWMAAHAARRSGTAGQFDLRDAAHPAE